MKVLCIIGSPRNNGTTNKNFTVESVPYKEF